MSNRLLELLRAYREGDITEDEVVQRVAREPFETHLIGKFDQLRETRTGVPEVVFAPGKEPSHVADLFATYQERGDQLIASRVTPVVREALVSLEGDLFWAPRARIAAVLPPPEPLPGRSTVLVVSAGASDAPVAEEAAVMCELLGNPTERMFDVGVAGISRIATQLSRLDEAGVVIVVAGMDGVLPSLVGGLAVQPVIAVPTSVGYGTALEGLAPLLTMLNSCSPGIAVMNIDNGFGAAVHATKINQLLTR